MARVIQQDNLRRPEFNVETHGETWNENKIAKLEKKSFKLIRSKFRIVPSAPGGWSPVLLPLPIMPFLLVPFICDLMKNTNDIEFMDSIKLRAM